MLILLSSFRPAFQDCPLVSAITFLPFIFYLFDSRIGFATGRYSVKSFFNPSFFTSYFIFILGRPYPKYETQHPICSLSINTKYFASLKKQSKNTCLRFFSFACPTNFSKLFFSSLQRQAFSSPGFLLDKAILPKLSSKNTTSTITDELFTVFPKITFV